MIFVAVGTQKFQMDRLLREIDRLIENKIINEPVFAQSGHSAYKPVNFESRPFLSESEFKDCIKSCDLLITHSGVATIIAGVKEKKPVVVVPRLAEFGEHVDDHQLQIAEAFSEQNFVIMCGKDDSLADKINEAVTHEFSEYRSEREKMITEIRGYLNEVKK